jgi:uncharacterized protein involved in exopolysaccharide biosynthesis
MSKVERKLFSWHRLYLQLQDARQRLKQLHSAPGGGSSRAELEAEVSRLQQESDSELMALNEELAASRRRSISAPTTGMRQGGPQSVWPRG